MGQRLGGHHPDMTIGVRESTCVAPRLLTGFGDDLGTGLPRALDQLVHSGLGLGAQTEEALALSALCQLVISDDPAESASLDEHESDAIVDRELQWLGHAVFRWLADGVEAQASR